MGLALVFRRTGDCAGSAHQDKATGWQVYQMEDPAPDLPGGLRLLFSFTPGRQMQYSRMVGGKLVPEQLPNGLATAQVVGQSARAAGAAGHRAATRAWADAAARLCRRSARWSASASSTAAAPQPQGA